MANVLLGSTDDTYYIFDPGLGGPTAKLATTDVRNGTIDGGAGTDTAVFADTGFPTDHFALTVMASGIATVTGSSAKSITFTHFETLQYLNHVVVSLGTSGNDKVNGSNSATIGLPNDPGLFGFAGNDTINGGVGADTMFGGAGNDTYFVDNAGDQVHEGQFSSYTMKAAFTDTVDSGGTDTVRSSIAWSLGSFLEKLVLTGSSAINGTGNTLSNAITGNTGANSLGGLGGRDVLDGGLGNDTLTGGSGTDTFRFDSALSAVANLDTITDYDAGGKPDRIWLDDDVFTALGPVSHLTALDPNAFVAGMHATTTAQHVLYDAATGSLYYDADGVGASAPVLFAKLGTAQHPALDASDFFVTT